MEPPLRSWVRRPCKGGVRWISVQPALWIMLSDWLSWLSDWLTHYVEFKWTVAFHGPFFIFLHSQCTLPNLKWNGMGWNGMDEMRWAIADWLSHTRAVVASMGVETETEMETENETENETETETWNGKRGYRKCDWVSLLPWAYTDKYS